MKIVNKIAFNIVLCCLMVSCNEFIPDDNGIIARVGSNYLHINDLKSELSNYKDKSDSLIKLNSLIDDWALNELLIQQAKLNLPKAIYLNWKF